MIYSLLVTAAPGSGHASLTAARFARAVIGRGHQLRRVFFLDDGALNGLSSAVTPQDETSPLEQWASLAGEHSVELVLCISSALKRGLLDASESRRYERDAVTVHPAFELGGLGLLVDAIAHSDRLLSFGP